MRQLFLFSLFIFSFCSIVNGQNVSFDKSSLSEQDKKDLFIADGTYDEGNWEMAMEYYNKLFDKYKGEAYLYWRLGVCYFELNQPKEAIAMFSKSLSLTKDNEFRLHLGKAYLLNYDIDSAKAKFSQYLDSSIYKENASLINLYMKYCENAEQLMREKVAVEIENIGQPINTREDEYVPVISSDENVLLFTYRGERSVGGRQIIEGEPSDYGQYFEDIFISRKSFEGQWSDPEAIKEINGYGHDACVSISNDGQKLYIYRSAPKDGGDIFESSLNGTKWSSAKRLKGDVNSKAWEGSVSLSPDGKTLYFSSDRLGGFGGKDLYMAELQKNGSWGNVQNLGETINTSYDEDAPFISSDNGLLIYSSNGEKSMGGYDILVSEREGVLWKKPYNIGYPINGTGNDIYYMLSSDGQKGYYASVKPEGYGKKDIYVVTPGLVKRNTNTLMVTGLVSVDGKGKEGKITVRYSGNGLVQGEYKSNSETGNYLINLNGGYDYEIVYLVEGFESKVIKMSAVDLEDFKKEEVNVSFYTNDFDPRKFGYEFLSMSFEEMLIEIGEVEIPNLLYKIQIGAYTLPKNFDKNEFAEFGEIEVKNYDDNITRFTLGTFSKLNDALDFRNKVRLKGKQDAFVIAIYNGKRTYLEDLIKQGVFDNYKK